MSLVRLDEVSVADWLARDPAPWEQLVSFGPSGFEAYARVRFTPDPRDAAASVNDFDRPDHHPTDLTQSQLALMTLDDPATPCVFAVWEGWPAPYLAPELLTGPLWDLTYRRYVLFDGVLVDVLDWSDGFGGWSSPPPAFVWPNHRQWCFACDVDPHWAGVGGSDSLIDGLLAQADLDVVRAIPGEVKPHYGS